MNEETVEPVFSNVCKIGTMMFVGCAVLIGGIFTAIVLTGAY
jgi:hypothetical protein